MSAEIVDFVARLSAINQRPQNSRDTKSAASPSLPYGGIESSHLDNGPSGQPGLLDLQLALLELRAELVKKQFELQGVEMDSSSAQIIGAQAGVIFQNVTKLAADIAGLRRGI